MPASGVTLQGLALQHPQADVLQHATAALGLDVPVQAGPARITATLQTPRGVVALTSV